MSDNRLLDEIMDSIQHVLHRPSMYGTLYEAESRVTTLLAVAMSLETGERFGECESRVYATKRKLTKDIPGDPCLYRRLSDEQLTPTRTTSSKLYGERVQQLCAESLTNWKDLSAEEFKELTMKWKNMNK
jgi:hypothetical protein